MKITKNLIKNLILEELEDIDPPAPEDPSEELNISSANVERLREMKAELDEMVDMAGPDVNEIIKLQLVELAREFETTITAFEEI